MLERSRVIFLVDDNGDALEDGTAILEGMLEGKGVLSDVRIVTACDVDEARVALTELESISDLRCLLIVDGLNGLGIPLLEESVARLGNRAVGRLLYSGEASNADPEPRARLVRISACFVLKGSDDVFKALDVSIDRLLFGGC